MKWCKSPRASHQPFCSFFFYWILGLDVLSFFFCLNSLDEAHVGKTVNAYLKDEFMFDAHPPLGKLILTGVASLSKYNGSFAFDEIGE